MTQWIDNEHGTAVSRLPCHDKNLFLEIRRNCSEGFPVVSLFYIILHRDWISFKCVLLDRFKLIGFFLSFRLCSTMYIMHSPHEIYDCSKPTEKKKWCRDKLYTCPRRLTSRRNRVHSKSVGFANNNYCKSVINITEL